MDNELMKNGENEIVEKTKPTNKFEVDAKDMIFACIFALAAILFSILSLWGGFKSGFTVTSIFTFVAFTVYLYNKDTRLRVFSVLCGILTVSCSVLFSLTSNAGIRSISFFMVIALSVVWFNSLVSDREVPGDMGVIRVIFKDIFIGSFGNLPDTLKGLFSGDNKNKKMFKHVLIGIVMAVPVVAIVLPLLISSDAAFEGLMVEFFDIDFSIVGKLIVGALLAPFVISFGFALKKKVLPESKEYRYKGIDNAVLVTFLSILSLCYVIYLVSQLAYFFSAFSFVLPAEYEFTVAAYARRGFFEMSIIAAINIVIIFFMLMLSDKKDGKICVALKVLGSFVGGFTLVIIGTALSKMVLYINSFGMTQLRITTSAFMVFLAVVFVSIIARLYCVKVPVIKVALVTGAVILSVLGIGNVNHVVADYNYNAYITGKLEDIDVDTIYNQGAEGVPYLVKLIEAEDEDIAAKARIKLAYIIEEEKYYSLYYDSERNVYILDERVYGDFEKMNTAVNEAYGAFEELFEEPFKSKGYNAVYVME